MGTRGCNQGCTSNDRVPTGEDRYVVCGVGKGLLLTFVKNENKHVENDIGKAIIKAFHKLCLCDCPSPNAHIKLLARP